MTVVEKSKFNIHLIIIFITLLLDIRGLSIYGDVKYVVVVQTKMLNIPDWLKKTANILPCACSKLII